MKKQKPWADAVAPEIVPPVTGYARASWQLAQMGWLVTIALLLGLACVILGNIAASNRAILRLSNTVSPSSTAPLTPGITFGPDAWREQGHPNPPLGRHHPTETPRERAFRHLMQGGGRDV